MLKNKTILGLLLALVIIGIQVTSAQAASFNQTGTVIGTINSISTSTDSTGNTIVVVTLTDTLGATQTVNLSVDNAVALGLVTKNADGSVTVNDVVGQSISIDQSLVFTDPCKSSEGADQLVGKALTDFFCGSLGVDYRTIQDFHANGFGYGEIAQACFMAQALGGDAALCESILNDKKMGDFSSLVLPNGDTPTNWGQLKKEVLRQEIKSLTNLGAIVSGRAVNNINSANNHSGNSTGGNTDIGIGGNDHGHGNGNGHGHGQGKGH
jgi:hypothetical protein